MQTAKLSPVQTKVVELAKRCGHIHWDSFAKNKVYGYNPVNRARISITVHPNTIYILVRAGFLKHVIDSRFFTGSYAVAD